ncbi:MAG: hypothetical protein IJU68_01005 [Bacteroidales bacterium]|nr:hypothetical protein [Bacteroidales bacterium]
MATAVFRDRRGAGRTGGGLWWLAGSDGGGGTADALFFVYIALASRQKFFFVKYTLFVLEYFNGIAVIFVTCGYYLSYLVGK